MKTQLAAAGGLALTLILSGQTLAAGVDQTGATRDTYRGSHPSFAQLDIDGNGMLSEAEAAGAKGLLDYWDQVDRNGDHAIERSEFAAFEAVDIGLSLSAPLTTPEPRTPAMP